MFTPIAISTPAPINSAYRCRKTNLLARLPSNNPAAVNIDAMIPITRAGNHIETLINAILSPTARASMLVATESSTRLDPFVGSSRDSLFSDFLKTDLSILTLTNASRPKATQWSYLSIKARMDSPAPHPITGIIA